MRSIGSGALAGLLLAASVSAAPPRLHPNGERYHVRAGSFATAYSVAFIVFQLPHGLFAVSIMTTFLPELTAAAQAGDDVAFGQRFTLGLRLMGLVILPASAGYVALSGPIVALLPLRGASVDTTSITSSSVTAGQWPPVSRMITSA